MKQLFLLLLVFTSIVSIAQRPQGQRPEPINITGLVVDQDTGKPLEYATLILQNLRNPDRVTGGITDATGKFKVQTMPGRYNVRIEFISYKTYELDAQTYRTSTDLGTIKIAIDVEQLEGVEVVGERTTVELRLDKKYTM